MDPIFHGVQKPSTDFGAVRSQLQTLPGYMDIDLSVAHSFALGNAIQINASGNFFYADMLPLSGYASIHFQDTSALSTPITAFPGCCFKVPFTQFAVENVAQPGLKLRLIVGVDAQFSPSNAAGVSILNSVSIVDGGKLKTLAGQAFSAYSQWGPTAAQNTHLQIKNPAGNTKRIIIRNAQPSSAAAGGLAGIRYDADLTTLIGNLASKRMSGAVSTAQLRAQDNAGLLGTGVAMNLQNVLAATMPPLGSYANPLTLVPGEGYLERNLTVNAVTYCNWDIEEEPV